VTGVVDGDGRLVGIITDGDIRRATSAGVDLFNTTAGAVMTPSPKGIASTELAAAALRRMEEYSITSLFVFDPRDPNRPVGIVHVHDLLKAGVG
jgi:arabinose-5-phosphate isomerase